MVALRFTAANWPSFRAARVRRAWWTGKDSNLRSPQGAADLQSAGFSHSPTRPSFRYAEPASNSEQRRDAESVNSCPKIFRFNSFGKNQRKHKTDSCPKTPARSIFTFGNAPASLPCRTHGGAGGGN